MRNQRHRRTVAVARELRGRKPPAEERVWLALRDRCLDGCTFRRQPPVGRFVVDVCGLDRRVALEVDGEMHDRPRERAAEREALLAGAGWRVPRISNAEVQQDSHRVLATSRAAPRAPLAKPPGGADRSPGR